MGGIFRPIFFGLIAAFELRCRSDCERIIGRSQPQALVWHADSMSWHAPSRRTVTGLGYELVDVEQSAGGLLRVYIDHPAADAERPSASRHGRRLRARHAPAPARARGRRLRLRAPRGVVARPRSAAQEAPPISRASPAGGRGHAEGCRSRAARGTAASCRPTASGALGACRAARHGSRAGGVATRRAEVEQVLDFTLDEVREARLVPVIDFKGAARSARAAPAHAPRARERGRRRSNQ